MGVFACFGLLIACLSPSRSAYAFEWGTESFPDDLTGVTVTLNDTLEAPPNGITNTWYQVNLWPVYGSAATPTGGIAGTSNYLYFENESSVQSGSPWYFYANVGMSLDGVSYIPPGIDYASRFAFDGNAGWWGLANGYNSPTITFAPASYSTPIYTNQSFIVWLVNNSDYRARYEGATWEEPIIAVVMNGVAWSVDVDNPEFNLYLQRSAEDSLGNDLGNYVTVQSWEPGLYSGSLVIQQSGYYRFVFVYTINGVTHQEVHSLGKITVTVHTELSFGNYTIQSSTSSQKYIEVTAYLAQSVVLQFRSNAGANWQTLGTSFFHPNSDDTFWRSTPFPVADGEYQLVAYDTDGNSVVQYIGNISQDTIPGTDTPGTVSGYISTLVQYITEFVNGIGDMFAWLPSEIRMILIACIGIMVILGLFGWLKN